MSRPAGAGSAAYHLLWDDARTQLHAWQPPDPGQAALRGQFLGVLREHPDALSRQGPPAHFTVGVIVLDAALSAVLLTHHRKANAWFQFGGHLEPGDASLLAGAAREGREESGLADLAPRPGIVHLDRHALPSAFGSCREHLDIRFAAVVPTGARPVVSEESHDVRWWPIAALPPGAARDLGPLITAAVALLGGDERADGAPALRETREDIPSAVDSPTRG